MYKPSSRTLTAIVTVFSLLVVACKYSPKLRPAGSAPMTQTRVERKTDAKSARSSPSPDERIERKITREQKEIERK